MLIDWSDSTAGFFCWIFVGVLPYLQYHLSQNLGKECILYESVVINHHHNKVYSLLVLPWSVDQIHNQIHPKKNDQELDKACLSPTLTEMATYYFDGQVNFDFDDDGDDDGYPPLC